MSGSCWKVIGLIVCVSHLNGPIRLVTAAGAEAGSFLWMRRATLAMHHRPVASRYELNSVSWNSHLARQEWSRNCFVRWEKAFSAVLMFFFNCENAVQFCSSIHASLVSSSHRLQLLAPSSWSSGSFLLKLMGPSTAQSVNEADWLCNL